MPTTHNQITTAREYFDEIVQPDFDDASRNIESLRAAFHCAGSLYHLHEFVFSDHKYELGFSSARQFDKSLCANSDDFQLIRDVANTAKHMEIDRDPQRIRHIANTAVQSTAFGEGAFGVGPYGGGRRVRIHIGPKQYQEFSLVSKRVLKMWTDLFAAKGW